MDFYPFYLATGGSISLLILLVGHYFPWHKLWHKLLEQPLNRLWPYCYGSTSCWVGFSYWRYFGANDLLTPLGLMIIYIVSGLTVGAAYWLDVKGQDRTIARRQSDEYPIVTADESINELIKR